MNKKGYSLLEVLAVLAIIAIAFSLLTLKFQNSLKKLHITTRNNKMALVVAAEKLFLTTTGNHSIEFLSGEPLDATCQLVRTGYLNWNETSCHKPFIWSQNENGDYLLSCTKPDCGGILYKKSEFEEVLFIEFPDDGETSGGTGDEPTGTATPQDDYLIGTKNNDVIDALAGDDTIMGKDGDDVLMGNNGNDTIKGGNGKDNLSGGNNNDTIYGGNNNDYLDGGNGDDKLYGEDGDDIIDGGNKNDTISGGKGQDIIYGFNGQDEMYGNEDNDELYGENGNDTIAGGLGNDNIYGGNGTDTAVFTYNYEEYIIVKYSKNYYIVTHPIEGEDNLFNIEKIKFTNRLDKISKFG
ncbi:prepilin-type N-terminal cleavage/methylation domain-containing protein [Clostridium sp. 'deep sea']|uniref:prepilin-type N-terminal cleavage/methylation domain-containing protein n=1 Tax=Clostridium sp. 'deep sea' TaxID=2779445 RepID=UPI001896607F|nr:prepilin-type N-terminal cleavage/methylation domain-containing protein [Clostridium sp. 'deep sea']QOR34237.1 prepilin-type N-terminal cleavage/methylation domain-containing protein [Clostridium sp. 'deep sea']